MKRVGGALVVLGLLAGCSSDDGPLRRLGKAACEDRRDGLTFFQIARGGVANGMERKQVAQAITLGVEHDCPEYQDEFYDTAIFTDWQ